MFDSESLLIAIAILTFAGCILMLGIPEPVTRRRLGLGPFCVPALFVAIALSMVGCSAPCHTCGPCHMPPCPPPTYVCPTVERFTEPMHPILRRDGRTEYMPHGAFKAWVTDDAPSTPKPAAAE